MANLFDYLQWRADIPLSVSPFNEVDNLILAELSYTDFDGILSEAGEFKSLEEVSAAYFRTHSREALQKETAFMYKCPLLMDGLLSGARFRNLKLGCYINEVDGDAGVQIAALTFLTDDGFAYVAFRGTDSSLTGWREDFNLGCMPETAGQRRAKEYLDTVGLRLPYPLRVGGHSKGGNFAVYAAAFCVPFVRDRIVTVFSNDAPGFREEVVQTEGYRQIVPRVYSVVPDTSVIGRLLENSFSHHVVKSSASGIMQHDGFSWLVSRDRFEDAAESEVGQFLDRTLDGLIGSMDNQERQSLTDIIFSLLASTGLDTFHDIGQQKLKSTVSVLSALSRLPKDRQAVLLKLAGQLIQNSGQSALTQLSDMIASQAQEAAKPRADEDAASAEHAPAAPG